MPPAHAWLPTCAGAGPTLQCSHSRITMQPGLRHTSARAHPFPAIPSLCLPLSLAQASESPLTTAVAAGYVALPPLLKLAGVMERNGQVRRGWQAYVNLHFSLTS